MNSGAFKTPGKNIEDGSFENGPLTYSDQDEMIDGINSRNGHLDNTHNALTDEP